MIKAVVTGARLGHVHLKVSELERAISFYRDVLGMQVTTRYGRQAAFLSYDGYHHHLGLNTWESEGAPPPPRYSSGLYHLALLYPTRQALASVVRNVLEHGCDLDGASDHGVSQAVYLHDPDENGVELYWDRPAEEWPRKADGEIAMVTERLDLEELLALSPQ
jgi:catechol 2,3-dioxygenase